MIIAVGGHSRNVGKTSVVCGIISGLRDLDWTAVKITQYGHRFCSRDEPCECFDPAQPVAVSEQLSPDPGTDSGRYLLAGARRSFWLRTPVGRLAEAMDGFREIVASSANLIVESNSLLGLFRPDLYLMVADGAVADFKPSSLRFLDRASIIVPTSSAPLHWLTVPATLLESKAVITALPPNYSSPALCSRIRSEYLKIITLSADQASG